MRSSSGMLCTYAILFLFQILAIATVATNIRRFGDDCAFPHLIWTAIVLQVLCDLWIAMYYGYKSKEDDDNPKDKISNGAAFVHGVMDRTIMNFSSTDTVSSLPNEARTLINHSVSSKLVVVLVGNLSHFLGLGALFIVIGFAWGTESELSSTRRCYKGTGADQALTVLTILLLVVHLFELSLGYMGHKKGIKRTTTAMYLIGMKFQSSTPRASGV